MNALVWIGFVALILAFLLLDLGVFHRKSHVVSIRESIAWTGLWVVVSLAFNVAVYYMYEYHWLGVGTGIGHELPGNAAALQFLTGYLLEKSLSLDNIFVIALIFAYFKVPALYQHRVLFWGILGALIMRGVMIATGAILIQRFDWITYVFGVILLLTAVKMLIARHDNVEPNRNPFVRLARRLYPVTPQFHQDHFFVVQQGRRAVTPLLLALIVVESTDVLFAVDSIPAIFAVTRDPFIVFTSNVFAILGLRSLYFALAGVMARFRYVKFSLVFILAFVGVKMILSHHHPIPVAVSLAVIIGLLVVGVTASLFAAHRDTAPLVSPLASDIEEFAAFGWKHARRVITIVVGMTVLILGLALLVLPGPAVVVIPIGLAILGTEFVWARRLLRRLKGGANNVTGWFRSPPQRSASFANDSQDAPR